MMNNGYSLHSLPQMGGGQMHPLNPFTHFQQNGAPMGNNMGYHTTLSNILDISNMHNSVLTPPIPSPSPSSSPVSNSLPPMMQQQQQQQQQHHPMHHQQMHHHHQQMHHQAPHHHSQQNQGHHHQQHHQHHQQLQHHQIPQSQQQTPQPSPQHSSNSVSSMLTQSLSVPTSSDSIQSPIYDIHDHNALLHQQLNSQQSPQQNSLPNGNSVNNNLNNHNHHNHNNHSNNNHNNHNNNNNNNNNHNNNNNNNSNSNNNNNNNTNSGTNSASSSTSVTSPNTLTPTNGSIVEIISSPKTKSKKVKTSNSNSNPSASTATSTSTSTSSSTNGSNSATLKGQKSKPSHSPLENSLNSLTKEQLVQLCTQFFEVNHPNLIQEFENAMPPPDLHEIMEELDDLQKKYNKLYPNNKFCYDNQSYNRVKSGLAAFKKALVEYGENFKEKNGWATLLQYVILAIPYALRMPLWDDEKNNASRISALSKMDVFGKAAVKGLLQNDIPLEKWERHRVSLNPHAFYLRSTIEELDKCIEKRRKKEEKYDKQSKKRKKSEPKFN